jgi:hypothetical protein
MLFFPVFVYAEPRSACTEPRSWIPTCPGLPRSGRGPVGEPRRAKLQSGRSPDLSLRPRARSLPRLQNPIGFQTLAPSPQPRAIPSPFLFNPLQTLFSPRRATALNNPFGIMRFRTLFSPHRTTALNNTFGFKWFRTLSRHNGGIRVFDQKFLNNHLRFPFLLLSASAILRRFCALTPLFVTDAQKQGGGGSPIRTNPSRGSGAGGHDMSCPYWECGTRPSVLDEFAQPPESGVPLPGDQIKVAADILEALLIQSPNALPAVPSATHETRVLHDAQVFGDCLTRDVEASGKPRNGRRSVVTEARDQPQAGFVSQRCEEWRRAEQLRRRPWTTPPGQGTSRSASRPCPSLARWPGMPSPDAPGGFDRSRIR